MDPFDAARSAALSVASAGAPRQRKGSVGIQQSSRMGSFNDMPAYLQDNEFIVDYYRPPGLSGRQMMRTMLTLHNETGNIWTHLIGALLFLALAIQLVHTPPQPLAYGLAAASAPGEAPHSLPHSHVEGTAAHSSGSGLMDALAALLHVGQGSGPHHHGASALLAELQAGLARHMEALTAAVLPVREPLLGQLRWPAPRWPALVFMGGAILCMLLSAMCHFLYCCSAHMNSWMLRLDYVGIVALTLTSFFPQVYYAFQCAPLLQRAYLATTTALGAATIAVSLWPRFQVPAYRTFRAAMFAGLGMWGVVPTLHIYMSYGHVHALRSAMHYDVCMGLTYVAGTVIYATRIPERWRPGAFDIWFPSHQIFHVAVVTAAYLHFRGVLLLLAWRDASGSCAAPLIDAY